MGELLWSRVARATKELRDKKFHRNLKRVTSIKREVLKKKGKLFSVSSNVQKTRNQKEKSPERKVKKVYHLPKIKTVKTGRKRILSMREQGYK